MSNYSKTGEHFEKVLFPEVGFSYHLSWAYKGAKFQITKIIDDVYCEVWTGNTKNKYLKVKIDDLRHLKNRKLYYNGKIMN
jgi:hypothetical protein